MSLFPSTRTDYVLFNEHFKPFQDVHVRRAISYAIDRESLVKTVLYGHSTVANSLFMPTGEATQGPYTYKLERTRFENGASGSARRAVVRESIDASPARSSPSAARE